MHTVNDLEFLHYVRSHLTAAKHTQFSGTVLRTWHVILLELR